MITDAELIVASAGDPDAFRELYDRWAETLLAYFVRRVHSPEVAADLLAETFAVAFERRGRFRDVGRPGGAWLYGIAAKELSRFFRRQKVELRAVARLGLRVPELAEEDAARIVALADLDAQRPALLAALGDIPPGLRQAVSLRVIDELDYEEIANRLSCSPTAARVRVHRGLKKLNELMEASA